MKRTLLALLAAAAPALLAGDFEYRVLATTRTSTMEKEMNQAADAGFAFAEVMGGETAFGGNEVVVVMAKDKTAAPETHTYTLLATSKTSTMEKEMQKLGDEGYEYKGQSVFKSLVGAEVAVIMERGPAETAKRIEYKLLATSRTSTMEKELIAAGQAGYRLLGLTVGKSAFGGREVICILRKN